MSDMRSTGAHRGVVQLSWQGIRSRGVTALAFVLVGLVAVLLLASPAWADDLTAEQEEFAKKIEGRLIAPCCYTQTVDVHESESAEMIKSQVRMMVAQGKTEDEILDTFVEQYGETILAAPRASGFNLVAYILPVVIAVVAAAAIAFLVVRWRRRPGPVDAVPVPAATDVSDEDALRRRLDQELKEFDR